MSGTSCCSRPPRCKTPCWNCSALPALSSEHLTLLNSNLESDYVAHLPTLLPNTKPPAEQSIKNRSRAFSAFTLRHQLGISEKEAADAVIDDFEDVGIDAIYLHGPSQTLYFVQTKLKQGAEFRQEEALAFCQGVRKCLVQDFTGFNTHFTRRQSEIESALDECVTMQLIVAHTRARNHQNKVESADFLALDDEQERLRRELAVRGIQYSYKAEQNDGVVSEKKIKAPQAIHALALFHRDPRYILWLKNEPSSLLDIFSERYKNLVNATTTPFQVVNAVRFARYAYNRMDTESQGTGPEKLTYKHGASALAWILAKRLARDQSSTQLFQTEKIKTSLSVPFDELRQTLWDETKAQLAGKTPLVMYRSQERTLPIAESVMLTHYGLSADPVIAIKRARPNRNYPEELFDYMISKAPQIGGLA